MLTTIIVLTFLPLLTILRYPLPPAAKMIGAILILGGLIVSTIAGRHLSLATLIALPQIHPTRFASKLVTTGIYGFVRHPRYGGYWLIALGLALTTGFLVMWELFFWAIIGFSIMAYLEEKELQKRFGNAYKDYMTRVPAFLSKLYVLK